jgi:hypothetical protein
MTNHSWTKGFDAEGAERPKCLGCDCDVPLVNGMHHEETDIPGVDYVYPCTGEAPESRIREMPKGV